MNIKDYDIAVITDNVLNGMQEEKHYPWDTFCEEFLGMNIPPERSKAYIYYVRDRAAIKNSINAELVKRKQGVRLVVKPKKGVELMGTVKAPIRTITTSMKKRNSLEVRSKDRLESFLNSPEVSDTYKGHLRAIVEMSEGNHKNFIGHVICSNKLPGYIKTAIIQTLPKNTRDFLLGEGEKE